MYSIRVLLLTFRAWGKDVKVDRDPSSTNSKDGDLLRIASKFFNVVLNPLEGQDLILQAQVTWQNVVHC